MDSKWRCSSDSLIPQETLRQGYCYTCLTMGGGEGYFGRVTKDVRCDSNRTPPNLNAHSSTPTPGFLTSREETQTMVREKLGPKPRPRQILVLPGKGKSQTMV